MAKVKKLKNTLNCVDQVVVLGAPRLPRLSQEVVGRENNEDGESEYLKRQSGKGNVDAGLTAFIGSAGVGGKTPSGCL